MIKKYTIVSLGCPKNLVDSERFVAIMESYGMIRTCLLYTSDAADDLPCVDLGGRRLIKKKKNTTTPDESRQC